MDASMRGLPCDYAGMAVMGVAQGLQGRRFMLVGQRSTSKGELGLRVLLIH